MDFDWFLRNFRISILLKTILYPAGTPALYYCSLYYSRGGNNNNSVNVDFDRVDRIFGLHRFQFYVIESFLYFSSKEKKNVFFF